MRENDISAAILNLSGDEFERFGAELVSRSLYPGLNPTSPSHDLGEDARTEPTTLLMHNSLCISLAVSKIGSWTKIREDCQSCRDNQRRIDTMVFVTAGTPRDDTVQRWKQDVNQEFGWDLEVRTLRWLAPVASRPEHEGLVDDYLGIPPPDRDFIQNIEKEFSSHTRRALRHISLRIPGIRSSLSRDEVNWVEDQLVLGKPVILSGDAGTGKSGIGAFLSCSALEKGSVVLLLDARQVGSIHNESGLRQHLVLNGPISSAIKRVGLHKGCRLIIDQLDNVAGSISAQLLVDLAVECASLGCVEVVVISRSREGHETRLLDGLVTAGFVELRSHPLGDGKAGELLDQLGITRCTSNLITLSRNLLNLELIGRIQQKQPDFDFLSLTDEVDLWEQYIEIVIEREAIGSNAYSAEQIVQEAVGLAQTGLSDEDRTFSLEIALPAAHQRLISWGILVHEYGRVYRFRHEKFQDFLYAWDATQRGAMPSKVIGEINAHRSRSVFTWMEKIYASRIPQLHTRFLREMLNVPH